MAYDIFRLQSVVSVKEKKRLPLKSFKNGSIRRPEFGSLLIWDEGGEFVTTGHVAVVTEVYDDCIRFVEQNVDQTVWPEGQNFSRQLKAQLSEDGGYWLESQFEDATILGWVTQTDDATYAENIEKVDPKLFHLSLSSVEDHGQANIPWLNVANDDEAAFVKAMGGHKLTDSLIDQYRYFLVSDAAFREIKRAANGLHGLFMHATNHVMEHPELLEQFCIPSVLWPRIKKSWDNRRNQMICGRLDFAVSDKGIKLYEYNADSSACLMECAKIQGKWASHFGCQVGRGAGEGLYRRLVEAWKQSNVKDVLHIMQDDDPEEKYHALFMKDAMESAGLECKIIQGVSDLQWGKNRNVVDGEGQPIKWVWKTWAWETALDQIRVECEQNDLSKAGELSLQTHSKPRLADVLFGENVMVYEPLWTLIPSNKAILPIIWKLYPNHPYLLNSQNEVSEDLRRSGYVAKPISGRCGQNVSIYDDKELVVNETVGQFANKNQIYQELFPLPKIGPYHAQIGVFIVSGSFGGACVRVDPSLIVTVDSDLMPLRVEDNDKF